MKGLFHGTSSWSEKGWKGVFYPEDLPPGEWLSHYARVFPAVEADVTYYRVPSEKMVIGWREKTPPGFQLCAKFPRDIVHGGKGPKPDGEVVLNLDRIAEVRDRFLGAMAHLEDRAGPLVLQFPYLNRTAFASPTAFLERLDTFLESLPSDFRYAVEVRNKAWVAPPLLELLRRHEVPLVLVDLKYMPHPDQMGPLEDLLTGPFVYTRLIGDRDATEAATKTFDRVVLDHSERLRRWAETLVRAIGKVPEAYVFANNHFAGHAPETIRELKKLMDESAS